MTSSSQAATVSFDHIQGKPSSSQSAHNVQDMIGEVNFSSPKGTKYWVPEANNKPVEGTIFDIIEEALKAYKAYAIEARFEVRKGGSWKTTTRKPDPNIKHFHCVRQGFKPALKPTNAKNDKGERSIKRLQSQAEIDMIQSNRTPRYCRTCKTYGLHDSRNCPTKKKWLPDDDSPNRPTKNKGLADEPMDDADYVPQ
ncbi:hypothetical protein Tco_1218952 [Tanacetum coccineum]